MPTGYTNKVQDGTVTDLRTFAMLCARAFGALITLRDEPADAPIPHQFEAHTAYYDKGIRDATARQDELSSMTPDEIAAAAKADHLAAMDSFDARGRERETQRQRYSAMLDRVMAWNPPEAYSLLKLFMAEQLEQSIAFDCVSHENPPVLETPSQWALAQMEWCEDTIKRHTKNRADEIERVSQRNVWLNELRTSLSETK